MENNEWNGQEQGNGAFDEGSFQSYEDKTQQEPDGGEERYTFEALGGHGPHTRAWSVASLVLGIISLLCCCLSWGAAVAGAMAIICAIISRRTLGYFDGLAVAGLITGIIGTVFGVYMGCLMTSDSFQELMEEIMKEYEQLPETDIPSDPNVTFALPFQVRG